MRKLWILASAVLLSCIFGSGYFYFFSVFLKDTKPPEPVSSPINSSTLYYNQIGVYANTTKMEQEVIRLENKGIEVYTYRKNDLTVYVTHPSKVKETTVAGQSELTDLGFVYVLKEENIVEKEVLSLLEEKLYQKALEMNYED